MKIRKRVTNGFMVVLVLTSLLMLQGCSSGEANDVESSKIPESTEENLESSFPAEKEQNEESLLYFSDHVSAIKVTHSNSGGQDSWEMDEKDIPQFREWALSLRLESQNFGKGESPGEYNGGDAYSFEVSDDAPLNFTYMDIGDGNYYICIKDQWYLIANHINIPEISCAAEPQTSYKDIKQLSAEYSEDMAIRDGVVVNKFDETLNKDFLFAGIGGKDVWKGHISKFRH